MIFAKSIKQMLRTPLTTALFVVLFAVSAFFVCTGAVIWARNNAVTREYESTFVTIGTIKQSASSFELTERWDAFDEIYRRRSYPSYDTITSPEVLDFKDAGYILKPEKRPFYGAWCPDYQLLPNENPNIGMYMHYIVEATPQEDFLPNYPHEMLIKRVLTEWTGELSLGAVLREGGTFLYCDHYNDNPQPLYAGKIYLIYLYPKGVHNIATLAKGGQIEYTPRSVVFSTQYLPDGTPIPEEITTTDIVELYDGFYETQEGKHWLTLADNVYKVFRTLPVIPTNGTHLLLPFYNGGASIEIGEDITAGEYAAGERVCLVSNEFANFNGLSVGDSVRLPLYFADYKNAANDVLYGLDIHLSGAGTLVSWNAGSLMNAKGEPYQVFSDHDYVIKGIYINAPNHESEWGLGANAVIVPAASIQESDAENILAYGSMLDATTAFQIPNGTIEEYTKKWAAQGVDNLEFTFRDRGYTQLKRGLDNMKRISLLFLIIGAAMSLTLAVFFCHLFISRNKLRTAIERMLGYSRKQCVVSLLAGFLLAAVLAITLGSAVGLFTESKITGTLATQEYYDTSFTQGALKDSVDISDISASPAFAPLVGLALFAVIALISLVFIRRNINEEPLVILGE